MSEILLIGGGGHALACADVIEQQNIFRIAGFVCPIQSINRRLLKYPLLGNDEDIERLQGVYSNALVAVGQIKSPNIRVDLYQKIIGAGFSAPTIISPYAYVSPHAVIGFGTIVMHGAIINAGASIGSNCIINTGAIVDHDVIIEDHCHISTGAVINGQVIIGEGSFIGSGSLIMQDISIGPRVVVGMGQVVRTNLSHATYISGGKESI